MLSTNSIVPARPIYSFIFHDVVFMLHWKHGGVVFLFFSPPPPSLMPRPVRGSPSASPWNIDVESLESWVSHLSWWYHKAAINSVREHQIYHRHIIGYEDITEGTCLETNRPFPGGRPSVDSQRSFQSLSPSPLGLPQPLFFSLLTEVNSKWLLGSVFFMVELWICKCFGSLHNHKQRDHLLLACWLTLCLLFNGVFLCLSDVLVY